MLMKDGHVFLVRIQIFKSNACVSSLIMLSFFFCLSCSVARADLYVLVALLALDEAAPVELAPAPLDPALPAGLVAPVAAHQVATVQTGTVLQG